MEFRMIPCDDQFMHPFIFPYGHNLNSEDYLQSPEEVMLNIDQECVY